MTLHFGNFPEYLTYSGAQENCQNAGSFGKKWLWNGLDCGVVCSEKNNYFFGVSLKKIMVFVSQNTFLGHNFLNFSLCVGL